MSGLYSTTVAGLIVPVGQQDAGATGRFTGDDVGVGHDEAGVDRPAAPLLDAAASLPLYFDGRG